MGWFEDLTKGVNRTIKDPLNLVKDPASNLGLGGDAAKYFNTVAGSANPLLGASQAFNNSYKDFQRGNVSGGISGLFAGAGSMGDPSGLLGGMAGAGYGDWVSNPGGELGKVWAQNDPDSQVAKQYARYSNLDETMDSDIPDYWYDTKASDMPNYDQQLKTQQDMMNQQQAQQQSLARSLKRANAAASARNLATTRGGMAYGGASAPATGRAVAQGVSDMANFGAQTDADLMAQNLRRKYEMDLLGQQYAMQAEADRIAREKQARANQQGALQTAGSVVGSLFG